MSVNRRDFVAGALAAGAVAPWLGLQTAHARETSDIRVAQIGTRGQGRGHIRNLHANLVALCDVDEQILAERADWVKEEWGREVDRYTDYRELLERDDIDAVSIATPNHTHALITIAAAKAGKDVYVEKPVSHNVWEGRQMVAAAEKYGRIIQTGTQSRSSPSLHEAVKYVQDGQLGKIRYAIGTCYKPRKSIGQLEKPLEIPGSIHYDLWCGPAEKRDIYRPELHYDWHWDFNTGNGDLGNQGIHQMDIARWFLGEQQLAPRALSIGGRLGYDDAGNTPNSQVCYLGYEAAPLIFETRGLPRSKDAQKDWGSSMDRYRGSQVGVVVQCEGGHVLVPSYHSAIAYDKSGKEVKRWEGSGNHHANWLEAVAKQDASVLNAPILEGHLSSALCHLGHISHRLGEKAAASDIAQELIANDLLTDSFERLSGHLRANDVDIDSGALTLGPLLKLDPQSENFNGNQQANALLRRDYREPFEVPQIA